MEEPLLQTKFHIPVSRPGLVPRPRLIEHLNQSLSGQVTLISAPAGFGKTTVVSSWLQQANLPVAWLSLDKEDHDLARFWTYFIAALRTIFPEIGTDLIDLLQSVPSPRYQVLLTPLINDLSAVSERFVLVLDDYHTVESETIDQALSVVSHN